MCNSCIIYIVCYFEGMDFPSALLAFQSANQLIANAFQTLYYIGLTYTGLGEVADAARTFRKALKLNPEDAPTFFALGSNYLILNKRKKAKEALDILYMLDENLYDSLKKQIDLN